MIESLNARFLATEMEGFIKLVIETSSVKFTFKSIKDVCLMQRFYKLVTIHPKSRKGIGSTDTTAALFCKSHLTKLWPEIQPVAICERALRGLNPVDLSVVIHVPRTGSHVMYEKTIDEVMCQRIYGIASRFADASGDVEPVLRQMVG